MAHITSQDLELAGTHFKKGTGSVPLFYPIRILSLGGLARPLLLQVGFETATFPKTNSTRIRCSNLVTVLI